MGTKPVTFIELNIYNEWQFKLVMDNIYSYKISIYEETSFVYNFFFLALKYL